MASSTLLSEDISQDYVLSEDDVQIYAQQIGIDICKEKHLMWIAEKGLSAEVPKPWLIFSDKKERIFYYNPKTKEKSWQHPLDKEFAALVSEERNQSKSLNSASSDYGFESKLSSLADAPPLSSNEKNSPVPFTRGKKDGALSGKKLDFGRIENRRGTQLAPVQFNTRKMPAVSMPKSSGSVSFMPKGSILTKNIKRAKDNAEFDNQLDDGLDYSHAHLADFNESVNSEEGSKYSYEETDDEEKPIHGIQSYDMLDASQLSPMHSTDESPDAFDINSLVQFGTKLSSIPNSGKKDYVESVYKKEIPPSIKLQKICQPPALKPLTQTKKKGNKGPKNVKKQKIMYSNESEAYFDEKIATINEEQHMMLEQMQKEWLDMQDELEKRERDKYDQMVKDSAKKFEEEELKLRNENAEKISKIKSELQKKVEEEETAAEKSLQLLKDLNKEKMSEEQKRLQTELETSSASLKAEIKRMEEKNQSELAQRKKELEEAFKKELDSLKVDLDSNKKSIEEAHASEISSLQESHKHKIDEMKSVHEKEVDEISSTLEKSKFQEELEKLEKLIKSETENYQNLLKEKEIILKDISSEKSHLEELKRDSSMAQTTVDELQDDVEKIENELDLLRSEKSGLVSELNVLKTSIESEKFNLLNPENASKVPLSRGNCSKNLCEVGINTNLASFDGIGKSAQTAVMVCDVSSQVEVAIVPVSDVACQTSVVILTVDVSCQTEAHFTKDRNVEINGNKSQCGATAVSDKNLENALSDLSKKIDSRVNIIEQQLRLLQENLSRPKASEVIYSSQEFAQNPFTEVRNVPTSENRHTPPIFFTDSSVPAGLFPNNDYVSSQSKCKCELGDSASCSVLQDVKNTVYRFNDILCSSYISPFRNANLYQVNQPVNNYSSPFGDFYSQFRQMQEKHRLTELKHKCENDERKLPKDKTPSSIGDVKTFGSINLKLPHHLMCSDAYSHNVSEDPMIRAQNLVLREKAKAWKEQQSLNASVPHIFSVNLSSESSQSSVHEFASPYTVPSSEQTFLNFEVDPETDYNMWMSRLNALQLRIRRHKLL